MDYEYDFGQAMDRRGRLIRLSRGQRGTIGYVFDDLPIAQVTNHPLSAVVADMLDVFLAIALADRFSSRSIAEDDWHRTIQLTIPVREFDVWRSNEVDEVLHDLVEWTVGDAWNIRFVRRIGDVRRSELQLSLPSQSDEIPFVTLNSGGLDSALGIVNHVVERSGRLLIPVTVVTSPRIKDVALGVVGQTRESLSDLGPRIDPVSVAVKFRPEKALRFQTESSYRARSLFFLAAGAATAAAAGSNELSVTENGIGAISLPFTPDQVGTMTTKSMHPRTLRLFGILSTMLLGAEFTVTNEGATLTKGQLCSQHWEDRFIPIVKRSVSCDRTAYDPVPCGQCTSCIGRAIALGQVGVSEGDSKRRGPGDHVAVAFQVELFRNALDRGFRGLRGEFPELGAVFEGSAFSPAIRAQLESDLVSMVEQYVCEYDSIFGSRAASFGSSSREAIPLSPAEIAS